MNEKNRVILVTGASGFLGRHLVDALLRHPYQTSAIQVVQHSGKAGCDLRDRAKVVDGFNLIQPNLIFHLAANCGGIGANRRRPAEFLTDNLMMGLNVLEAARRIEPMPKVVLVGSVCSYPRDLTPPFKETDLWNGFPESTNAPYGEAKRALLVAADAYRRQYGLNVITPILANLYGPGDHFTPVEDAHVIPAMIVKLASAKPGEFVKLWGSGRPTREFLYVEDAADALCFLAEKYDSSAPINVGNGYEFGISTLAAMIAKLIGKPREEIVWDRVSPDGQPRRSLDISKIAALGWEAKMPLSIGLRQTIDWYRRQTDGADAAIEWHRDRYPQ